MVFVVVLVAAAAVVNCSGCGTGRDVSGGGASCSSTVFVFMSCHNFNGVICFEFCIACCSIPIVLTKRERGSYCQVGIAKFLPAFE